MTISLELHEVAWSEWNIFEQVCTIIDPVSLIQNKKEISYYSTNQEDRYCDIFALSKNCGAIDIAIGR
jgi:hypothetical protein